MRLKDLTPQSEQEFLEEAVVLNAIAVLESVSAEDLTMSEPKSADEVIAELFK